MIYRVFSTFLCVHKAKFEYEICLVVLKCEILTSLVSLAIVDYSLREPISLLMFHVCPPSVSLVSIARICVSVYTCAAPWPFPHPSFTCSLPDAQLLPVICLLAHLSSMLYRLLHVVSLNFPHSDSHLYYM